VPRIDVLQQNLLYQSPVRYLTALKNAAEKKVYPYLFQTYGKKTAPILCFWAELLAAEKLIRAF
jgi:hypothetical protein